MSLSRKNYEAVAEVIAQERRAAVRVSRPVSAPEYDRGYFAALDFVAEELADYFASDNPNFDRARFLKAAGVCRDVR